MDLHHLRTSYKCIVIFFSVCSEKLPDVPCGYLNQTKHPNGTCYVGDQFEGLWNYTVFNNKTNITRVSASEEYYK